MGTSIHRKGEKEKELERRIRGYCQGLEWYLLSQKICPTRVKIIINQPREEEISDLNKIDSKK